MPPQKLQQCQYLFARGLLSAREPVANDLPFDADEACDLVIDRTKASDLRVAFWFFLASHLYAWAASRKTRFLNALKKGIFLSIQTIS